VMLQKAMNNPALKKTRAIKDCATGDWWIEFQIVQVDGRRTHVLVQADKADKTTELAKQLTQKGAQLPLAAGARASVLDGVICAKPPKIVHRLANSGWQLQGPTKPWFCCGPRLFRAPTGAIEYAPPLLIEKSRARAFAAKGTLEEWKTRVAETAMLSTSLTVLMSAAPAAPLVRFSGLQNFSLHVGGPSRVGKSTVLIAIMSFFGFGLETDLPTWNTSKPRLLETAAAFGDVVFPLNEVGAKKGQRSAAYHDLRETYAQYAECIDYERHSVWENEHGQARRFFGICVSTAEHSVKEYATMAGEVRDAGELFRAMDVSAVREGSATIFDLGPQSLDQRAELEGMREATAECHGTAWTPYINYLIEMGTVEVERRTRALMKEFVDHMPETAHDGVIRQIAMHFGLLYAGAIFAIESGIFPWTRRHVQSALTRAFRDAVEASKPVDLLAAGLDLLRLKMRDEVVERKASSAFGVENHAGYWERIGGKKVFVVHETQFRAWFANRLSFSLVQGSLATKKVSRRWPNGSNVRCVEFVDPFPETNPTVAGTRSRKFKGGN
jgi:hypothetical protein